MKQSTAFHDAPSIIAHARVEDRLRAAAREAVIAEAEVRRPYRRASVGVIGHLLVRLGAWLQVSAMRPTTMEETVQCS